MISLDVPAGASEAVVQDRFKTRQAGLVHGRHVGKRLERNRARHRHQRAQAFRSAGCPSPAQ